MSALGEPATQVIAPQREVFEHTVRIAREQRVPPAGEAAAAARSEGRERFAAYVAHELRTPLATQRALLELALSDPGADVDCWREIGEDVLGACRQQERLLEACLMLARSQGRLQRSEPVDLAAIAAEALRDPRPDGARECHRSRAGLDVWRPWTYSSDSSPTSSRTLIRHNIAGGRIEVATRAEPGGAVLSLANTGPLIPAGEIQRLFEPFERLGSHAGLAADGVGLGLAIVAAIAVAHDATIAALARTGGGLGINVVFPPSTERNRT